MLVESPRGVKLGVPVWGRSNSERGVTYHVGGTRERGAEGGAVQRSRGGRGGERGCKNPVTGQRNGHEQGVRQKPAPGTSGNQEGGKKANGKRKTPNETHEG